MHIVQNFGLIIWCCFLLIMLSFAADNEDADVIKHCMNSTNSTSCSLTYEQVYKSLTKNENSFNISHVLYPEGRKPSFLVKVNVYGPNKSHNSIPAKFTWSIHCLFSSVPASLLEMLSLGSIIVTSRTQELNIQIPAFCCNLSENIENRKEMIQGFLTRAVFELQDLAVSPDIRDPSLNTAQCVKLGHLPIFASDTKGHVFVMLMVCVLFVVNAGRIFSWAIVEMNELRGREIKNTALSAVCFSIHFLSVLCTVYVFVAYVLAFYFSPFFSLTLFFIMTWTGIESFYASMHPLSFSYVKRGQAIIRLYTFGGNTICYLSCWLVIGIRINPSWGLTVALFIISIFASSTYAVYLYLEVIYPNGYNIREREDTLKDLLWGTYSFRYTRSNSDSSDDNSQNINDHPNRVIALLKSLTSSQSFTCMFGCMRRFRSLTVSQSLTAKFFCMRGCIAVGSFFVVVILAGPSIGGQTAADELLTTSSLYFITAFITWATLKKRASIDAPLQNERPQNAEGQDTEHHTGDHPGGELGTRLVQNNYYHDDRRVSYEHSYITRETRV